MSQGVPAGRLSVEIVAEMARLQNDVDRAKRLFGSLSKDAAAYAAATNRSMATIGEGVISTNFAMQKLMASHKSLQAAVNANTGVSTGLARDAADIQAYGQALDNLRAKYSPLFAIGQQYKAEVAAIRQAHAVGALSANEMAEALARAKTQAAAGVSAFRSHGVVLGKVGHQSNALRHAMMGASYQVQDFFTQVSMGANPLNALAVQGGQLAGQFANIEGKAGAVARFMMGPWGLAITGAVMVTAALTKGMFDGAEAAAEKEKAAKALAAEMDNLYESNMRAIKSERQLQVEMIASAAAAWEKAKQVRQATFETLVQARAELQSSQQHAGAEWDPTAAAVGSMMANRKKAEVAELDRQLDAQTKRITELGQAYKAAQIPVMQAALNERADAGAASLGRYNRALGELNKRYSQGKINASEYGAEWAQLTKTRNAEQAAIDEANKKDRNGASSAERRAASIQRETNSLQAKIEGLLALADAYAVSDAAAMRAEATMRAHERAIRKGAETEKFVADEMRRTVAERIASTAKSAADLERQARDQALINQQVRSGAVDAHKLSEAYADLSAQREALAALDAAQALGDPELIAAATAALNKLVAAQRTANQTREAAQDLQRSDAMRREIADIEAATRVNVALGQARMNIMLSSRDGFGQDQALARANAESEKALIWTRALTEAERARKDGLIETEAAILDKARAEIAAVETSMGLQTAEEAFGRLRDLADGLDLSTPFGRAGAAIRDMIDTMDDLREAQETHQALVLAAGGDANKIAKADAMYQNAKVAATMKQIGAAKSMFKENSAGYKAMAAAEKAYAMVQLANTAINVASGAAKIFASLGPWAFPVVAAMVGVMASLGFRGGKGGTSAPPPTPEELQAAIGTGTVYGNSSAQSESLARALDILAANSNSDLEYSNDMLRTLRSIDGGIGQLAGKLGAQIGLGAAGMFDTSSLRVGTSGSSGFLGLFGSSTTRSLYDQGIQIYAQSIDRILAGQFNAQVYNVIQQVKKKSGFLGIGGGTSTSYSTTTNAINQDVKTAFADIIRSVSSGVVGVMAQYDAQIAENLRAAMLAFKLPAIKFSTQSMNGEEIEKALNAYFSSVADQISGLAARQLPVLNELARNGEGMFETLSRVIKTFGSVNIGLSSIGIAGFGSSEAGLKGASQLTDLFGDLDSFQSGMAKYADKFLSEAERMAPIIASVQVEMARLGMAGVTTNDQFKVMVAGLNLNTEAGRDTFAALMAVAPAFAKVTDYLGDLNNTTGESITIAKKRRDLEIQIMELQGRASEALAARREKELLALEESLRPLQMYIYALQDEATAKANLRTAYDRESQALTALRDKFDDLGKTLREYRTTLLPQLSSTNAYARAQADFRAASAAAQTGDADAMARLSQLGDTLLGLSSSNARSQIEYLRDVAMVTQAVDAAIGAAEDAVDYQQAQLDALHNIVSGHIDLNENVIRVADAIEAIQSAQSGMVGIGAQLGQIPVVVPMPTQPPNNSEIAILRDELNNLSEKMERVIEHTNRTATATEKANRDGWARVVDNDHLRVREQG